MKVRQLHRGQAFRVPELGGKTGEVVYVNECRARIRWAGANHLIAFDRRNGERVEFVARGGRKTDVAPSLEVEPL